MSDRIRAALATLDAALSTLERRPKPRKPASAAAIAKLEAAWSRALPPMYRALLELRDGFADRARDPEVIGLFSIAELTASSALMREAAEWKTADPDCAEAKRVLIIGRTLDAWTLLDPGDGDAVVTIDSEYEITSAVDAAAYLEACAVHAHELVKSATFVRETSKRAKEIVEAGAQIMGVGLSAISPDGRTAAVFSYASLNLFDLGAITERDNNRYAPCTRWIDALLPPTQLRFSADSKTVVCLTDAGAVAFDVTTGEPCATPASHATGAAIKLSNRFSRRDGIRLP